MTEPSIRTKSLGGIPVRQAAGAGVPFRTWCGCCGDGRDRRWQRRPVWNRTWNRKRLRLGGKSNIRRVSPA